MKPNQITKNMERLIHHTVCSFHRSEKREQKMLMLYKQWQRNICRTSKEKRWSNTSGRRKVQNFHLIPFLSGTHCHLVGDFRLLESPSKWIKNVLKFQQQVEEGKMNC